MKIIEISTFLLLNNSKVQVYHANYSPSKYKIDCVTSMLPNYSSVMRKLVYISHKNCLTLV